MHTAVHYPQRSIDLQSHLFHEIWLSVSLCDGMLNHACLQGWSQTVTAAWQQTSSSAAAAAKHPAGLFTLGILVAVLALNICKAVWRISGLSRRLSAVVSQSVGGMPSFVQAIVDRIFPRRHTDHADQDHPAARQMSPNHGWVNQQVQVCCHMGHHMQCILAHPAIHGLPLAGGQSTRETRLRGRSWSSDGRDVWSRAASKPQSCRA